MSRTDDLFMQLSFYLSVRPSVYPFKNIRHHRRTLWDLNEEQLKNSSAAAVVRLLSVVGFLHCPCAQAHIAYENSNRRYRLRRRTFEHERCLFFHCLSCIPSVCTATLQVIISDYTHTFSLL